VKVDGENYRSIWLSADGWSVEIIDQTKLPHEFVVEKLTTAEEAANAISEMLVRGAPLIGATAAYGMCLGLRDDASDARLEELARLLIKTRPTAVNLRWAMRQMQELLMPLPPAERIVAAYEKAARICNEDVEINSSIGEHGLKVIEDIWQGKNKNGAVNILTHCNAGWLATVDWGTALSPIYKAHNKGIPIHVWVDETRPRNQGAHLTAWELGKHGVEHTLIVDNAGGHLMQHGQVDLCITGTDRTTASGDVCNKIGTYLKALAAKDNKVPFYVALPSPTIDWEIDDGIADIPIEVRNSHEIDYVSGYNSEGKIDEVRILPKTSASKNYAFDVTPAHLVTGLITERGVCSASKIGLAELFQR
jgi:methylthioribose-1-phosphate isomerase